jgi:hypothetical protein
MFSMTWSHLNWVVVGIGYHMATSIHRALATFSRSGLKFCEVTKSGIIPDLAPMGHRGLPNHNAIASCHSVAL